MSQALLHRSSPIEPLEDRIAPAMASLQILSPHVAKYTDTDGDLVTVTLTKGTLAAALFTGVASGSGDQWQELDLSGGGFDHTNVTVTVVKTGAGDGLTSLGYLNSTGHPLGAVSIQGDLGRIDAADTTVNQTSTALVSLTLATMGRFGVDTQAAGGSIRSTVDGALGKLLVNGDMQAALQVNRHLGSVYIGGSLLGGALFASGTISCVEAGYGVGIGSVVIKGSITGGSTGTTGILGADDSFGTISIGHDVSGIAGNSGEIRGANCVSLTIGGNLVDAASDPSSQTMPNGNIVFLGKVGTLHIHGDLQSNSTLGASVEVDGSTGIFTLDGSITGTGGFSSKVALVGVGQLTIGGDIVGGTGTSSGDLLLDHAASIHIGGSLKGGGFGSGSVVVAHSSGTVVIGGDLMGGAGGASGSFFAGDSNGTPLIASLGHVELLGSILGGGGTSSGVFFATGSLGTVHLHHDLTGGAGPDSGQLQAGVAGVPNPGNCAGLTIDGTLSSGGGSGSGLVDIVGNLGPTTFTHGYGTGSLQVGGRLASLLVKGDLAGGSIEARGGAGPVTVTGSFASGQLLSEAPILSVKITATDSGYLGAESLGSVQVGGDLTGTGAEGSGLIQAYGSIGQVTIGGSVIGGSASAYTYLPYHQLAAQIYAGSTLGSVTIAHDLRGGGGDNTGKIEAGAELTRVSIGGSILGGGGLNSGTVTSSADLGPRNGHQNIGSVRVGGDLTGGGGDGTGTITAEGQIASISLGGNFTGGTGTVSGAIESDGNLGPITIGGSITGLVGSTNSNATIRAGDELVSLSVHGNVTGAAGEPVILSGRGPALAYSHPGLAIGRLFIGGNVQYANVLAGYDSFSGTFMATNANAGIGSVSVGGSWTASNLVAGVANVPSQGGQYGNDSDALAAANFIPSDLPATIASVIIRGAILGTAPTGDHFGFSAALIGSFINGTTKLNLHPGPSNDVIELSPSTGDLTIREVASS